MPDVELVPVGPEHVEALTRLSQLERHDLSEFRGTLPGPDGLFPDRRLPLYLEDPEREALLIRSGGHLVGFVLVRPHEEGGRSIGEFFVVRAVRRTGIGSAAAHALLRGRPGRWGIAFQEENAKAARLWRRIAAEAAVGAVVEEVRLARDGVHADTWLWLEVADPAVQQEWDAFADSFDDEPDHGLRDPEARAAWASSLAPLLPEAPASIADIGCGTGTLSVMLAEAGYAVRGIDLSPRMVELAREKALRAGVRIDVATGDASYPPWPAAWVDVVLARHVVWALPDAAAALGRWIRLLAPGGRLVLVEGFWGTGAGLHAEDLAALLRGLGCSVETTPLTDPLLWGGPVDDERYAVVARPAQ
ncbi:MAG TPA: GNAT family N-acetyltransferase [Candidatus Nanopelagicales bacterium]|nr:GNAT family N-acetyltransferase [Candidatus Nanopelagicales bacterium]